MPARLRFGIPSLDVLFGEFTPQKKTSTPKKNASEEASGLLIRGGGTPKDPRASISLSISGPDGTGKSILGLHLVSAYLGDCYEREGCELPRVLYVSTDLKYQMAQKMWRNFGLDYPLERRRNPIFPPLHNRPEQPSSTGKPLTLTLAPCFPLRTSQAHETTAEAEPLAAEFRPLSHHLSQKGPHASKQTALEVLFVDLASITAGDDWGFVNRVLSLIAPPPKTQPRHLLVIDSIEGFETLVGEHDAYGEAQSRRSRIAQIMRSAADKFHMLFIVEEPEEGKRLPEEFITDVVIRLRSTMVRDYVRRTIEIEKARGHSHVRGQHAYLIRSGKGSTTGLQENHDDPIVLAADPQQAPLYRSYLHVCHSIHYLSRDVMRLRGKGRPVNPQKNYAAFGIRYLDDMLEKHQLYYRRKKGDDQRGLRGGTTTALIGNSETKKSPLGIAFLSRCFREYAQQFVDEFSRLETAAQAGRMAITNLATQKLAPARVDLSKWQSDSRNVLRLPQNNQERRVLILNRLGKIKVPLLAKTRQRNYTGDYSNTEKVSVSEVVKAASWALGAPQFPRDGIPVLLTTQDIHAQELAARFMPWLMRKLPQLQKLEDKYPGTLAALRLHLEEFTICRRLEIHDLPSSLLIHIVQSAVSAAQNILHENKVDADADKRFAQSWGIRVVIDDFSIMKNTYLEIREEPLLLRYMTFYLGREGVTTLLIDTQSGRPDPATPSAFGSELATLVDHCIYTWRFSFYGENRVAIAPIPPISPTRPAVVRELRERIEANAENDLTPLLVDPHFELYSGIEQGEPQPIPLQVRLFAETETFQEYIQNENIYYREMFTPLSAHQDVIAAVPPPEYDALRDFAYLQRDTRIEHTLVLQVDEFWYLRRNAIRRAGTFRSQAEYLRGVTAYAIDKNQMRPDRWRRDWATDPFGLFQPTEAAQPTKRTNKSGQEHHLRYMEFEPIGYDFSPLAKSSDPPPPKEGPDTIDRVPFMWDFGFLLCRREQWDRCQQVPLAIWNKQKKKGEQDQDVADVWQLLPLADGKQSRSLAPRPRWRLFLEACYHVARVDSYRTGKSVAAFDLHIIAAQSLSSLILEIWASEIYDGLTPEKKEEFLDNFSRRRWDHNPREIGLTNWLDETRSPNYRTALFKTWLLLVEVLDLTSIADLIRTGEGKPRMARSDAVAVRHWYKTACQSIRQTTLDEPLIPVGLPGHFSVRGDWFLAVAGSSRSNRLADRVLDLLNSRRANYTRLELGLGLPVRRMNEEDKKNLRTGLYTLRQGNPLDPTWPGDLQDRAGYIRYDELCQLGGTARNGATTNAAEFYWFWRSSLSRYHRHAKIWQDWIHGTILWWERQRDLFRKDWVNAFERYDNFARNPRKEMQEEAYRRFMVSCDVLHGKLLEATRLPQPGQIQ